MDEKGARLSERALIGALVESFRARDAIVEIVEEPFISDRWRADLRVISEREDLIVEVMSVTPQTRLRLGGLVDRLTAFRQSQSTAGSGRSIRVVLVAPSSLTPAYRELLYEANIEFWDDSMLFQLLRDSDGPNSQLVRTLLIQAGADAGKFERPTGAVLTGQLSDIQCGKQSWSRYQRTAAEILEYLFCPPLERPLYESANETKINRRDIVLPNYAPEGFWKFMRDEYRAHHVVVDAKNYCLPVKKMAVLQLANYLSDHGTGLFGLILTRVGEAPSARLTRREQWIVHRKMIVVLDDADLEQMLTNKDAGRDPETVIRQKIEDFRLSF